MCGDDGCGSSCGDCPPGLVCAEGDCVSGAPDCSASCESLGLECGLHCDEVCGSCGGELASCEQGICVCEPDCRDKACGDDNGCLAPCEPCPNDRNCDDCILQFFVLPDGDEDPTSIRLAVDYHPTELSPLPTMIDLRIEVPGDVTVQQAQEGNAIIAAEKSLTMDPATGDPFLQPEEDVLQFLMISAANTYTIESGRLLELTVRLGSPFEPVKSPVTLTLLKREQTMAPPPADQALWGEAFDTPLAFWPWLDDAP